MHIHKNSLPPLSLSLSLSLPLSPSQDGNTMLWDLNEGKHLYTLSAGNVINALVFSPNRYWLCAATGPTVKIWVRNAEHDIILYCNSTFKALSFYSLVLCTYVGVLCGMWYCMWYVVCGMWYVLVGLQCWEVITVNSLYCIYSWFSKFCYKQQLYSKVQKWLQKTKNCL